MFKIIQKRKEGKSFFPTRPKEKRAKEESKVRTRRKSIVGHIKTHPQWQMPNKGKVGHAEKELDSMERARLSQPGTSSQSTTGFDSKATAETKLDEFSNYEDNTSAVRIISNIF